MDYEADAYEIGRTPFGQLSKFGVTALNASKKYSYSNKSC